jgi:3-hydroxyisobutyrate dehydrogenase-like beta-hydroxyacid dehydrogenase
MNSIRRIGIVGLGAMGRPMGRHLLARGFTVLGTDPSPTAQQAARALGIRVLASPAEVALEADLVQIVVGFDSQVEQVMFGDQGLRSAARPGLIVAIGSTISPSYARNLAERTEGSGLILLDIPLTRGERAAEDGTMLILGGGDAACFEACKPVFASFASDVFHLGLFGAGQVGKMVNNMILWACTAANDEGLRLGEALGVDPERLREALGHSSAQNWSMTTRADDRAAPWAEKDMMIVLHEADIARLSLPLCGSVKEVIKGFKIRHGHPMPRVE